jgi:ankyrin repeat protein
MKNFLKNIRCLLAVILFIVSSFFKGAEGNEEALHRKAMKILLGHVRQCMDPQADLHAVDQYGHRPLDYAPLYGNPAIVRLLIERGADRSKVSIALSPMQQQILNQALGPERINRSNLKVHCLTP